MQYIDKDALVAEIDKLYDFEYYCDSYEDATGFCNALDRISAFINTLEVKEVDLEEELSTYWDEIYKEKDYSFNKYNGHYISNNILLVIIKHFFELGLKAQQNISIDITTIDEVIEENGVDPNSKEAKMFKESYYTALEKLKAQKGE